MLQQSLAFGYGDVNLDSISLAGDVNDTPIKYKILSSFQSLVPQFGRNFSIDLLISQEKEL
jgi:hypothetical protein